MSATDLLLDLEASLTYAIETLTELPEPTSPAEATGQAVLAFRLSMARRAAGDLRRLQTPARRDPFSAAGGADAIATPGGPVFISTPGLPADVIAVDYAGLR